MHNSDFKPQEQTNFSKGRGENMMLKEAFASQPVLKTERLTLRKLQNSDAEGILELYQDPEVVRWLDWNGAVSLEEARFVLALFEQQTRTARNLRWGLTLTGEEKVIGSVVLMNFRRQAYADIGYDLSRAYWGRGLMQEALTELLRFCDRDLGLQRIQAYIRPENLASVKLIERLGFVREGLLRKAGMHDVHPELYDVLLYARVP